jgi:hypothetical protein
MARAAEWLLANATARRALALPAYYRCPRLVR